MTFMGPFTFNAVRFLLGGLTLFLFTSLFLKNPANQQKITSKDWLGAVVTGVALFAGATLQQVGLVGTTAGKAGFITGLYVVLVPLLGLVLGQNTSLNNWLGALLAVGGLFLLSIREDFSIAVSDLIVLIGAFIWAVHVHLIGFYTKRVGPLRLSIIQFLICGALSLLTAFIFETPSSTQIYRGWLPLAYGAFLSVGLAYTLQVVAQKKAEPSHAAIILSLESMFAAVGGWLILGETLGPRGLLGAGLMLAGMIISQLRRPKLIGQS